MDTVRDLAWPEANHRHLVAALEEIKALLRSYTGASTDAVSLAAAEDGFQPALDLVCDAFGLGPFERRVLLLAAGPELSAEIAELCATAHGAPDRAHATPALALAALPGGSWAALAPGAPLRYWRLVRLEGSAGLATARLSIDERILQLLTGVDAPDERLAHLSRPAPEADHALAASHQALAERLSRLLAATFREAAPPVVQLCGGDPAARTAIAAAACDALEVSHLVIRAAALPTTAAEAVDLVRLCEREAVLSSRILVIEAETEAPAQEAALDTIVDTLRAPLILSLGKRRPIPTRRAVAYEVEPLPADEARTVWLEALGRAPGKDPGIDRAIDAVVYQFSLGLPAIRAVAAEVETRAPGDLGAALWDACREQARPRLDDLAQRVRVAAAWDDLVLPAVQTTVLRDIVRHVRQRPVVYGRWGFDGTDRRGLGISALFAGSSGTGKTTAAEVLAADLRLDLYRIDLSSVVSKYIGETEKNMRRVFDAAETGGAVLLFDEADALFGKRTEVKDSHDRFANIETSYLLQRMETYRGVAILTTNQKDALDRAFLRRLRFIVDFPFPDPEQRAEIWRRAFPAATPLEGIDPERLARLHVAGGNIRNIALGAAFLAAEDGGPVRMAHILGAARDEYDKLGRQLTDAETKDWT